MKYRKVETNARTVVELLDVAERDDEESARPHVARMVRVNGQPVRVASDGVEIDFGENRPTIVTLRLLADEVRFW